MVCVCEGGGWGVGGVYACALYKLVLGLQRKSQLF